MSVAASGRTNDEIIRLAHEEDPPAGHGLAPPARHPRAVTIGLAEQNDRFLDLFGRLFA